MSAVSITNPGAFLQSIERQKLRMLKKITAGVRAVSKEVLTELIYKTPQYTGTLASNWQVVLGSGKGEYVDTLRRAATSTPFMRGMAPATVTTLAAQLPKLDNIRWNTKVTLANPTPYAAQVEDGVGPKGLQIREVNKINGAVVMGRLISMKYELDPSAVKKAIRNV